MGPRLISRGDDWAQVAARAGRTSFNGAAADQPRRRRDRVVVDAAVGASMGPRLISRGDRQKFQGVRNWFKLQWGRG